MAVDSYKWLPPSLKSYFREMAAPPYEGIPWAALDKPVSRARLALVTTAGINVRGLEPPFDYEREQREPAWGDPTYRLLPRDLRQGQIQTGHLHINNEDIERDVNVALPVTRLRELEDEGAVGSLAPTSYSFMGYQPDTTLWRSEYGPAVARRMIAEGVDAVLLTPV